MNTSFRRSPPPPFKETGVEWTFRILLLGTDGEFDGTWSDDADKPPCAALLVIAVAVLLLVFKVSPRPLVLRDRDCEEVLCAYCNISSRLLFLLLFSTLLPAMDEDS